ncbi:hypothetical protein [Neorhizobium sp. LjRoot104]|uniref:hypothetical protein n=1 Tax=Neorhizobium sp. LjRoot104 TaxID=3342254 RepID=UPI003ECD07FC
MKVLMIHGIGQEGSTQQQLVADWTQCLERTSPGLLENADIRFPYYGTTLADWANGRARAAVVMGADTSVDLADAGELAFLREALEEAAAKQNISEGEIEAALNEVDTAVPMDSFIGRRLVGLIRALEKASPAKGTILMRVIKQGNTYLSSKGAAAAVEKIVRPYLLDSPQVLVTHSLGTVIAFKLLRELEMQGANIEIPLLVTLGSPLGLEAFKKKLGPPRRRAAFVKRWVNFFDPSDIVALGKNLDEATFGPGIENDGSVNNTTSNAHGIIGYLPHQGVIDALKAVL